MTFGQQPDGSEPQAGQPYNGQINYGQSQQQSGQQYGATYSDNTFGTNSQQYAGQPVSNQGFFQPNMSGAQYAYANSTSGSTTMDAQVAYSVENAKRVSIARAYGEMTIGLLITAVVAVFSISSGALYSFLIATGGWGWIGLAVAQIGLAIFLGVKAMSMNPSLARVMFYLYAALMGFTLSSVFLVYDLGTIGMSFGICAGFFFILTMLALTTKRDMLKAGPILMVGLLVLIVGQVILMFLAPSNTTMMLVSAVGVIIFAGLTAYDAQKTRVLFAQYSADPVMIKRVSIISALNLYLDFINMFLYLLRIFGGRN